MARAKIEQWARVTGPNLSPDSVERGVKNGDVLKSPQFKEACEKAGIPATRRQASRFRRKLGLAYSHRNK